MIVVSEMGEQWSPQTEPARQEEMEMASISPLGNTLHTIGIRMPKVPQEVPVEKASPAATIKIMAGNTPCSPEAEPDTRSATKNLAPNSPVMPDSVQAMVRIRIGATIALKPSGIQSVKSLKVITFLSI